MTKKAEESKRMFEVNCSTCCEKGHNNDFWNKKENTSIRPKRLKNKSKDREARVQVLLTSIDLLNYCKECKENAKSFDDPIQDNENEICWT